MISCSLQGRTCFFAIFLAVPSEGVRERLNSLDLYVPYVIHLLTCEMQDEVQIDAPCTKQLVLHEAWYRSYCHDPCSGVSDLILTQEQTSSGELSHES